MDHTGVPDVFCTTTPTLLGSGASGSRLLIGPQPVMSIPNDAARVMDRHLVRTVVFLVMMVSFL
jgi:hypothetical protein